MDHQNGQQTPQPNEDIVAEHPVLVDEVIDIEEYAKANRTPPHARAYVIRVDKDRITVNVPEMTGREILERAGKRPPENYVLRQVLRGGGLEKVELDQVVDFRRPGIEKFKTMLKTAQDGLS